MWGGRKGSCLSALSLPSLPAPSRSFSWSWAGQHPLSGAPELGGRCRCRAADRSDRHQVRAQAAQGFRSPLDTSDHWKPPPPPAPGKRPCWGGGVPHPQKKPPGKRPGHRGHPGYGVMGGGEKGLQRPCDPGPTLHKWGN